MISRKNRWRSNRSVEWEHEISTNIDHFVYFDPSHRSKYLDCDLGFLRQIVKDCLLDTHINTFKRGLVMRNSLLYNHGRRVEGKLAPVNIRVSPRVSGVFVGSNDRICQVSNPMVGKYRNKRAQEMAYPMLCVTKKQKTSSIDGRSSLSADRHCCPKVKCISFVSDL